VEQRTLEANIWKSAAEQEAARLYRARRDAYDAEALAYRELYPVRSEAFRLWDTMPITLQRAGEASWTPEFKACDAKHWELSQIHTAAVQAHMRAEGEYAAMLRSCGLYNVRTCQEQSEAKGYY
jgi:hypothetical protein